MSRPEMGPLASIKTLPQGGPSLVLGATDARYYAGLSENVYRFSPQVIRSDDRKRFHGTNERLGVLAYRDAVKFYVTLMQRCQSRF